jgi:hypothetical protein
MHEQHQCVYKTVEEVLLTTSSVKRVTQWVILLEQELLTLLEHLN